MQILSRDPEWIALETELKKNQIDNRQAETYTWPRWSLEFHAETPLQKNKTDTSGGGIYLRYDFLKALFSSDAKSMESLKRDRLLQRQKMFRKKIFSHLQKLLSELECARWEKRFAWQSVQTAREAVEYIEKQSGKPGLAYWQGMLQESLRNDRMIRYRLMTLEESFRAFTGFKPAREHKKLFSGFQAEIPASDPADEVQLAWNQRPEVKISASDWILAELNITQMRRKRLPAPYASLGLGNILLSNQDEHAPAVPSFGISMPIWDMGDIQRQIQKAVLERDTVKNKLESFARNLVTEIKTARFQLDWSREQLSEDKEILKKLRHEAKTLQDLSAIQRADFLDLQNKRNQFFQAEIRFFQTLLEYKKALIHLQNVRGDPLPENL